MNTTTVANSLLTGFLVNPITGNFGPVKLNRNLQSYYDLLDCSLITITYLPINGKEYCIIADDEGLFKPGQRVSAITQGMTPQLVGAILITAADDESEDFASITEEDIRSINEAIVLVENTDAIYPNVIIG